MTYDLLQIIAIFGFTWATKNVIIEPLRRAVLGPRTYMTTINSKAIIDKIIESNGHYSDDPQVKSIVKYQNTWGGVAYGLNYTEENRYTPTQYVRLPETIWSAR